jgi:four helix bundle protein
MLSYKKLDVYPCAIELLALAAVVLDSLSKSKGNASIADQLKRAALSVPLNIGEGAGKSTPADQAKHFVIARGSAMECGAIFDAALVLKLVNEATATQAEQLVTRIVGMLTKMCHFGGGRHRTQSTPTATATFPDDGHDHAHDYDRPFSGVRLGWPGRTWIKQIVQRDRPEVWRRPGRL